MSTKIPLEPAQVTKEWLEAALTESSGKKATVHELQAHQNKGGVLSCIFKATATVNGAKEKLFIKIMPGQEQPQRVFIENYGIDEREVSAYKVVFKQLEDFETRHLGQSTIQSIACKFHAGQTCQSKLGRGFFLVLQDISDDFQMPDFDRGLSDLEIANSLQNLAHFHALTYCLAKLENVDFLKDYKMAYHSFLDGKDTQEFIETLFQRALEQLLENKEENLAAILRQLSADYVVKFKSAYGGNDGRFLTHGDIWANNIMTNGQGECILVDWQFMCASSPYLDVAALAFMNQSPEEIEEKSTHFLNAYFDKFEQVTGLFKVKGPWEDSKHFIEKARQQGFLSLFVWLLVSFSPCVYSPAIFQRFVYIFKKALQLNPGFFHDDDAKKF